MLLPRIAVPAAASHPVRRLGRTRSARHAANPVILASGTGTQRGQCGTTAYAAAHDGTGGRIGHQPAQRTVRPAPRRHPGSAARRPALRGTDRRGSCRACERPRPGARGFGIPLENGPRKSGCAASTGTTACGSPVAAVAPPPGRPPGTRPRIRGAIERLQRTDGVGNGRTASAHIHNGNIIPGVESD